jgi:uncharacterized membrane protein
MRLLQRLAQGHLRLNRIEAFSDGVFAIVVTLLVLELKVPDLHDTNSASELGQRLLEHLPSFLSWLISFLIVCRFWLNHHYVLGLARHANYVLAWLNSFFLLFQSFIPFPTALMGKYPMNPLAVSLFGVVMAINTVLFMMLRAYVFRNLLNPELADDPGPLLKIKSWVGPLSFLVGAAAAWFNPPVAFLVYIITPLFFITLSSHTVSSRTVNPEPSADR